jgi:DNA-binding transcriptional ArsR family regulator
VTQVLRVHLTAEDLLRTRFARRPAPLIEVGHAVGVLQGHDPVFRTWRRNAAAGFPAAAGVLRDLIRPPSTGPLFIDPITTDLAEGLDLVKQASPGLVAAELRRVFPAGPPSPWTRLLMTGDRQARRDLDHALRVAHRHLFLETWPLVQAGFQAELAWRGSLIAQHGVQAALSTLDPRMVCAGTMLQIQAPDELDVYPGGAGLTLLPSATLSGRPTVASLPDGSTVIVYPALTPLPLMEERAGDPLAALLGRTRAGLLRHACAGGTTSELARELGTSPASVSGHTKTLRAAGLIATTRAGKAVQHLATPLGRALAHGGADPATAPRHSP